MATCCSPAHRFSLTSKLSGKRRRQSVPELSHDPTQQTSPWTRVHHRQQSPQHQPVPTPPRLRHPAPTTQRSSLLALSPGPSSSRIPPSSPSCSVRQISWGARDCTYTADARVRDRRLLITFSFVYGVLVPTDTCIGRYAGSQSQYTAARMNNE